ncbi:hypothetical protein FN846DRAFT_901822 [Sphaerosporella brunnea]|uniref:SH3 domain-containing protein n=1 Tax=Sphaerosporella brunnea TaxID=1250544 RepID=A0A5J5FB49_9PEZI|nr:hypothetical protein FN846DRAFT_901822 [Sphaerosporella brunnea]
MTSSPLNTNCLYKASLLRELEFLHTKCQATDEAHTTIQQSLACTREKLKSEICGHLQLPGHQEGETELQVEKGQMVEFLDDDDKDWFMGRV